MNTTMNKKTNTTMKKSFLCLLSLGLAMLPCSADVIPTRYGNAGDAAPAAQESVQAKLVEQGLSTSDAQTRTDRLTTDELAFFSGSPDAIQNAGGLYMYEWAIGGTVLGILALVALTLHTERADQLD